MLDVLGLVNDSYKRLTEEEKEVIIIKLIQEDFDFLKSTDVDYDGEYDMNIVIYGYNKLSEKLRLNLLRQFLEIKSEKLNIESNIIKK